MKRSMQEPVPYPLADTASTNSKREPRASSSSEMELHARELAREQAAEYQARIANEDADDADAMNQSQKCEPHKT